MQYMNLKWGFELELLKCSILTTLNQTLQEILFKVTFFSAFSFNTEN